MSLGEHENPIRRAGPGKLLCPAINANPSRMSRSILASLVLLAVTPLHGAAPAPFVQDRFVVGMWVAAARPW